MHRIRLAPWGLWRARPLRRPYISPPLCRADLAALRSHVATDLAEIRQIETSLCILPRSWLVAYLNYDLDRHVPTKWLNYHPSAVKLGYISIWNSSKSKGILSNSRLQIVLSQLQTLLRFRRYRSMHAHRRPSRVAGVRRQMYLAMIATSASHSRQSGDGRKYDSITTPWPSPLADTRLSAARWLPLAWERRSLQE